MPGFLADSNVLLDILTKSPEWAQKSARIFEDAASRGPMVINPIIYAELSPGYRRIEDLDMALGDLNLEREALSWEAGFLAGHCFLKYRRHGGTKSSPLPDFYIGAHAAVRGLTLLTRDPARYRHYFPSLKLLIP